MENTVSSENVISCNDEIKGYLLESSKWCKFLAIMGYVGMGLCSLLGLLMMSGLSFLDAIYKGKPLFGLGLMYIIIAVVYYFPTTYLYKFSERIKQGLQSNNESIVTEGFSNLKKLCKFTGIMTIVIISLYALALVILVPVFLFIRPI